MAKLGAGEVQMNLGGLPLRNVEVNMGAGELKLDLRGNPKQSYDVRVNGGVGSATIYLPKNVGISATAAACASRLLRLHPMRAPIASC